MVHSLVQVFRYHAQATQANQMEFNLRTLAVTVEENKFTFLGGCYIARRRSYNAAKSNPTSLGGRWRMTTIQHRAEETQG